VVLSLLPAVIKDGVGGTEGVVTLCLAVFAIGIAAGSLFAAHLSHARPNLALVPLGGIVMGLVGLDLAWAIGHSANGSDVTPMSFATSAGGFRMLADFFIFAFGGGLFVVPSFAAVQAWSAPSERARVIAAGNVLQAAFMVVGSLFVALLQAAGLAVAWIFFGLAVASFGVVWFVLATWGKEGVRDFGALLFRALFRVEVRGLENLPAAGTRMLIAPNHVSLVDGPLLHAVLPVDASFAVDTGISKAWWAKPFLKMIRHYTMDPSKPLAARDLIKLVASGEPVVIFPEGRITVTGSIMKVYDGTAMIADKADAVVVPVRIEGAQRSHLSYLKNGEIKRAWFPKVTISILPPVKLAVDQALRGKSRRNAAGAALQDVMIDAMVNRDARPDLVRRACPCVSRPRHRQADYRGRARHQIDLSQADPGRAGVEPAPRPKHRGRRERRRAVAELRRRHRRVHGAANHRTRARDAEFLIRRRQRPERDQDRAGAHRADLARLHRKGQARQADCRDRECREHCLSRRCARRDRRR
jgi:acyl-[acyl-carrier-protein]-phospholipid O-acyltransferase/long-chain-fatty-acid--[acyl-carrier-protein] ligase